MSKLHSVTVIGFAFAAALAAPAEERKNYFDDPFLQDCPVPEGPAITEAQMRTEAHARAERGTRCYESGRCIPRVKKAILADGPAAELVSLRQGDRRFAETSVWV